ncbi:uncharacterized protein LOC134187507 [Corticium candelabrum]|uniref:uncharacterized protein LOC134187507 n=1 Tax=Corticium candelabrum TaxID=121492 RepID=UPI002E262368|nr:uncharacterized protein LOC134187507 [Corticium candelabrum]
MVSYYGFENAGGGIGYSVLIAFAICFCEMFWRTFMINEDVPTATEGQTTDGGYNYGVCSWKLFLGWFIRIVIAVGLIYIAYFASSQFTLSSSNEVQVKQQNQCNCNHYAYIY